MNLTRATVIAKGLFYLGWFAMAAATVVYAVEGNAGMAAALGAPSWVTAVVWGVHR